MLSKPIVCVIDLVKGSSQRNLQAKAQASINGFLNQLFCLTYGTDNVCQSVWIQ